MKIKKHSFVKISFIIASSILVSSCCALCPVCCGEISASYQETETLPALIPYPSQQQSIELNDSLNQSVVFCFDENEQLFQSNIQTSDENKQERRKI